MHEGRGEDLDSSQQESSWSLMRQFEISPGSKKEQQ